MQRALSRSKYFHRFSGEIYQPNWTRYEFPNDIERLQLFARKTTFPQKHKYHHKWISALHGVAQQIFENKQYDLFKFFENF